VAQLNTIRVPVESGYVFGRGVMVVRIDAATDFDLRGKVEDTQARDKETGVRLWVLSGIDMDQLQQDEETGFARSAEVKIRISSPHRPVPPPPQVSGFGAVVEFEGLTVTPYTDNGKCKAPEAGRAHQCKARQAYSFRATGIREFAGLASTPA
jgi:hypothetical protein